MFSKLKFFRIIFVALIINQYAYLSTRQRTCGFADGCCLVEGVGFPHARTHAALSVMYCFLDLRKSKYPVYKALP